MLGNREIKKIHVAETCMSIWMCGMPTSDIIRNISVSGSTSKRNQEKLCQMVQACMDKIKSSTSTKRSN